MSILSYGRYHSVCPSAALGLLQLAFTEASIRFWILKSGYIVKDKQPIGIDLFIPIVVLLINIQDNPQVLHSSSCVVSFFHHVSTNWESLDIYSTHHEQYLKRGYAVQSYSCIL
jgi:hypothetical protein